MPGVPRIPEEPADNLTARQREGGTFSSSRCQFHNNKKRCHSRRYSTSVTRDPFSDPFGTP